MSDVTRILERAQAGDPQAADELLPLVYDELRKLAAARMANEAAGHTLQPTALVHEPGCDWRAMMLKYSSPIARTSSPRPLKPCAAF